MKNTIWIWILVMTLSSIFLNSCEHNSKTTSEGNWYRLISGIFDGREGAVSFTIGSDCYLGLGNSNGLLHDFWIYHTKTQNWQSIDTFPGGEREFATAFSINGVGYVGLGQLLTADSSELYYNDFYAYDTLQPIGHRWKKIANFQNASSKSLEGQGISRTASVSFGINGMGYVGCGYGDDGNIKNDFYVYNPQTNEWSALNPPFPGFGSYWGSSFVIGQNAYILNGVYESSSSNGQFYTFNADSLKWRQLRTLNSYPNLERYAGVGFSTGDRGYIAFGSNSTSYVNSVWEYNPNNDSWDQKTSLNLDNDPVTRNWGLSWSTTNGVGYLGYGFTEIEGMYIYFMGDFWEFNPNQTYNPNLNL